MAPRTILEYPDPKLRLPSEPVTVFDDDLARLVDDLLDTVRAHRALALSAPQIDDRRQVAVIDAGDGEGHRVYINPDILRKHGAFGFVQESCLSLPGVSGNVIRDTRIRVRAQDRDGTPFERELVGMEAVCLQHEKDHFAGRLFIDGFSFLRRWQIDAKFRGRAKAAAARPGMPAA